MIATIPRQGGVVRDVLHIGMHKTGTTAIQSFLQSNRAQLRAAGVESPIFGPNNATSQRIFDAYFRSDRREDVKTALRRSANHFTTRIFSSEGLYEYRRTEIARVREVFGAQATVICFIRDPIGHIVSYYKQLVKSKGLSLRIDKWAQRFTISLDLGLPSYYHFDANISAWGREFKDTRDILYSPRNVITDFLNAAEIGADTIRFNDDRRNEAVTDAGMSVILRANRMRMSGKISEEMRREIAELVRQNPRLCDITFRYHLVSRRIDLSAFLETFATANPESWKRLGNLSREPVFDWVETLSCNDQLFLKLIARLRSRVLANTLKNLANMGVQIRTNCAFDIIADRGALLVGDL